MSGGVGWMNDSRVRYKICDWAIAFVDQTLRLGATFSRAMATAHASETLTSGCLTSGSRQTKPARKKLRSSKAREDPKGPSAVPNWILSPLRNNMFHFLQSAQHEKGQIDSCMTAVWDPHPLPLPMRSA